MASRSLDVRSRILAEAESWLGTPYHHLADVKGRGVDCAMLLVRVFVDAGAVEAFDPRKPEPYTPDWFLHRSEEKFKGWVEQFGDKLPDGQAPAPADVVLFKIGRCASHGGIVIGPDLMIHADQLAGRVGRSEISRWSDRIVGYWSVRT